MTPRFDFGDLRQTLEEARTRPERLDQILWLLFHAPSVEAETWTRYALDKLREQPELYDRARWALEREATTWARIEAHHDDETEPGPDWAYLSREDLRWFLCAATFAAARGLSVQLARKTMFLAWKPHAPQTVELPLFAPWSRGGLFTAILGHHCVLSAIPPWEGIPKTWCDPDYLRSVREAEAHTAEANQ